MDDLKCSNPDCESRTGGSEPCFILEVTVYADRSLSTQLHKLEPIDFTCIMCDSVAKADEEEEDGNV